MIELEIKEEKEEEGKVHVAMQEGIKVGEEEEVVVVVEEEEEEEEEEEMAGEEMEVAQRAKNREQENVGGMHVVY